MSDTHRSRIARLVSTHASVPYTKALALVDAAAEAGALPRRLRNVEAAVAAVLANPVPSDGTVTSARPLPCFCVTDSDAGGDGAVTLMELLTHGLLLGGSSADRADVWQRVIADLLAAGRSATVVDFDFSPRGPNVAACAAAARAGGVELSMLDFGSVTAEPDVAPTAPLAALWADEATPRLMYVGAPNRGEISDLAGRSLLSALNRRWATRARRAQSSEAAPEGTRSHFVVLLGAQYTAPAVLLELFSRGRAIGLGVIAEIGDLGAWPEAADSLVLQRAAANSNVIMSLRQPSAHAAAVAEFLSIDGSAPDHLADELADLRHGTIWLRVDRPGRRLLQAEVLNQRLY